MQRPPWLLHPLTRGALHLLCALPLLALLLAGFSDRLGANPIETLVRELGEWALRLLLLTLAISPARVLLHQPALLRHRRALGLWTFAYASLHLLAYAGLDQGLDLDALLRDLYKRPFITVGMLAFLTMLPLALTSSNAAIRRLGGARWQALHRLVYAVAVLGCLHFWWMREAKNRWTEPAVYAGVAALLLAWRLWRLVRARAATPPGPGTPRAAPPG